MTTATLQFDDDQKEFLNTLLIGDVIIDSVVSRLKIDQDDDLYLEMVANMLKRQTTDFIVMKIWQNLSDGQHVAFREFLSANASRPFANTDELLMEFALNYQEVLQKIFASLPEFFEGFIKRFNAIAEA